MKVPKQINVSHHVTDKGEAVESPSAPSRVISYIPYGEIFVEQQSGGWQSPYLFNAKELDSETGLYYYGARYLDPSHAMWLSVDPLFEKYVGMSPYGYCAGNPVRLVDVDGRDTVFFTELGEEIGRIQSDVEDFYVVRTTQTTEQMYKESSKQEKGNSCPISEIEKCQAYMSISLACEGDKVITKKDIPWNLLAQIPNSTGAQNAFDYIEDDMTGGVKPENNMEYSFNINTYTNELYSQAKSDRSADPLTDATMSTPRRRYHTHGSGTHGNAIWQQAPSKTDIEGCKGYGNYTKFVWGMGIKKLYVFTENGVIATIPFSVYGIK